MNVQTFCPECGSTRLVGTVACPTCGRSLQPVDDESLEPADAPAPGWAEPPNADALVRKFWRGLGIGAFIALVVPISYLVLARLVEAGIVSSDQVQTLVHPLDSILFPWGVLLGPIGVVVAGRSAGIRGAFGWFVLMVVAVPVLTSLWLGSVMAFGSATGNPF
jgi:hypothetical protein